MPRKIEAYFLEIESAISEINGFVKGLDFNTYQSDQKTKAAVERKLMVIGEALNQAGKLDASLENKITDFKKIVSLRNILVHDYFGVDDQLIWDIVQNKLDALQKQIGVLN